VPIPDRLAAALADRYRIERELGAGGMATVYLAADLKHERRVAIKVLKPELAAVLGAERFVVEIKTTAALSHPHILPLFDSGEAGGFLYYVMPYIEGETIRDRLNRETQFSVDEAVRITREIADALDYAHRHGVIHRDIKPENILLHDGRAMVMDFGIALALSAAAGGRMTETGMSLGTPHYMSPEQATADKAITGRSDIYSLASVCYEMLSAEPPHMGGTAQAIIMKIIAERARPVSELRKSVPPHITSALEQALEKVPADRFESAKAFADALGSAGFTYGTMAATAAVGRGTRGGTRTTLVAAVVAALALVAAAAGWMRTVPEAPFSRVDLSFGTVTGPLTDAALSPDGRMIAVSGTRDGKTGIFVRQLDGDAEFRFVEGTETGQYPTFSPDNEWIAFRRVSDQTLVKVRVGGGGAVTLVPPGDVIAYHPDWGADDRIAFSGPNGGGVVDAAGGEITPIPPGYARLISMLPDGSGVLSSSSGNVTVWAFDTDSFAVLLEGGRHPVYSPTGHLLYVGTDGGLFAVGFDLKQHRVTGTPVRVLERVGASAVSRGFALSASGLLLQHDAGAVAGANAPNQLLIIETEGGSDTVRVPVGAYYKPRFSADGRRIAMEVAASERNAQSDIYTTDLVTGTFTQLTFENDNDEPAWSPDGTWLAFDAAADAGGERVCVKPADNSAAERCLDATRTGGEVSVQQWLNDSTLLYTTVDSNQRGDIFTVTVGGNSAPRPYLQTPFNEFAPRRSPDGSLIAFESNETGSTQLWMRDYPVPKGRWNLSRAAAAAPRWSPDGRFVYFWRTTTSPAQDTLFRARIERTPSIEVRDAEVVHTIDADGASNWDLHPDGKRFVVSVRGVAPAAEGGGKGASSDRYLLLQNWFSELRKLTASER
jgi:eukaryotic-like serine/threonine-protein kinase